MNPLPNQGTFPPEPVYQPTITRDTSVATTPEPVAAPLVGTGSIVGPLSREDVLTLKIAEHVLCRDMLSSAVASLLRGARKAGKSGVQKLVLAADLDELERRMQQADSVKWPNIQTQTGGATPATKGT